MKIEDLYKEYYKRIERYCASVLGSNEFSDDAAQQTFTQANDQIEAKTDIRNWYGWLKNTAHARCVDIVRHETAARDREENYMERLTEQKLEIDRLERELLSNDIIVSRYIKFLPDLYRKALSLVHIKGVSQKEAAKRLGHKYGYFRVILQRGRDKLKDMISLSRDEEGEGE